MLPSLSMSASPVASPSTTQRVKSDPGTAAPSSLMPVAGSAASNAYSSSVDADSVTRPRPSNRCSTSTVSALLGARPLPNAPLWQQSRTRTIERARLCCITSLTKLSSIAVARSRLSAVVDVAK